MPYKYYNLVFFLSAVTALSRPEHVLMREEYLSATLYINGHKHIISSDEYAQASLRFIPGWSVGAGVSLRQPEAFQYLLLDAHGSSALVDGHLDCLPAFQVGYSQYQLDNQVPQSRAGMLLGFSFACPINLFASIDFTAKRLRDDHSSDVYDFGSVGLKFKL